VVPVNPKTNYTDCLDEGSLRKPVLPGQGLGPWAESLDSLLRFPELYRRISDQSRLAAQAFVQALLRALFQALFRALLDDHRSQKKVAFYHNWNQARGKLKRRCDAGARNASLTIRQRSIQVQKADATRVDNEPPFSVVVNREEQDCIGSKDKQLPGGNKAAGKDGKRSEYPESIKEMWTEIGSLGLRIRIGAPFPQTQELQSGEWRE
jgi:uncharacterized protein YbdZ (MbtH family)